MAVTKLRITLFFAAAFTVIYSPFCLGAILPEQRADILYHAYDGGGVTIDGPSVLVRKNFNEKISVYGNYYVDMVTSASIDVLTMASEYTEERTEYSLGADYLNDRTIMSLSFTNSSENDYEADTLGFSVSQEFFGDLSTITMGFSMGDDTVKATGADGFEEATERKRFNIAYTQILSKRLLTSLTYESVIDEGFLRNPYRQIRDASGFITPGAALPCEDNDSGVSVGSECYPETRNSEAFALRGIYAITPQSSIRAEYRLYDDSWGVQGSNVELRYAQQIGSRWLIEFRYRQYQQNEADFYGDLFDFSMEIPEFYARDKELSDYSAQQFGIGVTYTFKSRNAFFNNSTLNFQWDQMTFDYNNFLDATVTTVTPGTEPSYSLDADVIRIFYSAFF
ncbi:MAG: DUF3570 domain-containing protein [Pseudomonadota bacterium]